MAYVKELDKLNKGQSNSRELLITRRDNILYVWAICNHSFSHNNVFCVGSPPFLPPPRLKHSPEVFLERDQMNPHIRIVICYSLKLCASLFLLVTPSECIEEKKRFYFLISYDGCLYPEKDGVALSYQFYLKVN